MGRDPYLEIIQLAELVPPSLGYRPSLFPMNTTTGPFCISFTRAAPSTLESMTTGIVTLAPSSPPAIPIASGSLLIIIIASAPAFWAFKAFVPNWQVFL